MTDDEILLLADQYTENRYVRTVTKEMMIEFARAVAAKEREACAAIADAEMDEWDERNVSVALNNAAAGIRARAWSDVADATKWVDELRGDDEADCYGDGNVYRGQRSRDSQVKTVWVGLTDNEILDTKFAKRFIDDVYAIVGQRDLLAFARELEKKWIARNEIHKR